ncbi:hypothetical protein QC763_0092450 [Podospora pseudopauciseta]|uniref:Uncharacterized protein n=1 Tax=Podospora pseudopauciseta TaxID=2093780 RepID=A0ABR0H470_9PEZI|nr:hypothetical protein QC763_0092450 [Podospora pseudopauciseta]
MRHFVGCSRSLVGSNTHSSQRHHRNYHQLDLRESNWMRTLEPHSALSALSWLKKSHPPKVGSVNMHHGLHAFSAHHRRSIEQHLPE